MEHTRVANHDDLDVLEFLVTEGRSSIVDARGGRMWLLRDASTPIGQTYSEAVEDAEALVLLACIDDVPLGFLLARLSPAGHDTIAVAEELFVTPEARGVGLGEAMMVATVAWATEHSCSGIDGYALPGDRATKNYFETFGLVARGIVVHRDLRG
jgi:GNAT superfamily N-acetyltransferase